ncbi:glycosyltransferase, group 1 family protein [Catonella morbi ATCC 51271]|uniref:Glycosyltransferase, group 1 family protein n=1 Tax=Catonella morbi ATCC 51271 TaxID=592026 RepID=V2Y7W5_9FIRM|nr:glycosyltransferase family 4 protein [Catonella morbi]ESL03776.1 glycosyltransferase, group 1 family protein [Catonella morbi ATCC 51271]
MQILFLTLMKIHSPADEGIYMDLMKCFADNGHKLYIVTPLEKKDEADEEVIEAGNLKILRCKTGNLFGVGMVEKGISQTLLPFKYMKAIERHFKGIKFDLILYSTPPISLAGIVEKIKKKTGAKTYLLLKDIFPQNAVDIGLISPFTAEILFRNKEKKLYKISDYIGCMSPDNVEYLLKHNELDSLKVEVCPNSIRVTDNLTGEVPKNNEALELGDRSRILSKYNIPPDKIIFLYGGNLGLPQDIPFITECIKKSAKVKEAHFVICGGGTEYGKLENFVSETTPVNLTLIKALPKSEYDSLVGVSDVGMIFLDHRFTIPNFPSRLLSYLKEKKPVLICTDKNTDIGRIAEENEFGLSSVSVNTEGFVNNVNKFTDGELRAKLGENGYKFLTENYTVENSYKIIMKHFEN